MDSVDQKYEADDLILPGFRFHPTDEELVGFYLKKKIQQKPLSVELIKQLDIYKFDPWDLPKLAASGEKEWYFYCPRDRKYRNSARPNRVTGAGFWKATGTDRPIHSSSGDGTYSAKCIGLKKSLVFYKGRAAKGFKTDWMMHEFRLPSLVDHSTPKRYLDKNIPANDSWAICKIFKKTNSITQRAISQSWVSSFSEPQIPKTIVEDSENTYLSSNYSIPLAPNNVTTTSPMHYLWNAAPNDPFEQSYRSCPLDNLGVSNSTGHLSSMLINMQSSMLEEFCVWSQAQSNNDDLPFLTSPHDYQAQPSNLMISTKEDDEITKGFMLTNPVMANDINNGVNDHTWAGAFRPSTDFLPLGLPLNISMQDVWKSNLFGDHCSPCPSGMSTSYSSY